MLVEPLVDPAVEAQAVSRVHRIGQQKKTYVHHFVVNNSVEQNVYKLNRERAASSDVSVVAGNRDKIPDQRFTVRSALPLPSTCYLAPSSLSYGLVSNHAYWLLQRRCIAVGEALD